MSSTVFRPVVFALALCALVASGAQAQDLEQTIDRIAAAWHRSDANTITALAARAGISVDVDGKRVGPLEIRQAAAVLRRVFEDRESVSAKPSMSRTVGGQPGHAFGEISWTTRARGTTIPVRATVFVALVREDDRWRVTEIRLRQ